MPTSTYFTGPIEKRMSDDLHLAGVAERTRKGYLRAVRQLAESLRPTGSGSVSLPEQSTWTSATFLRHFAMSNAYLLCGDWSQEQFAWRSKIVKTIYSSSLDSPFVATFSMCLAKLSISSTTTPVINSPFWSSIGSTIICIPSFTALRTK